MAGGVKLQNWVDSMVGYFNPMAGARRMQARFAMAAAASLADIVPGVRRRSASREGTLANWGPRRRDRFAENADHDLTMARAESLVENDGHATSCIDALALNVAGSGLAPQSYPDAEFLGISDEDASAFADSAEAAWKLWCMEADASGENHFNDIQYMAVRSMFVTGEFLHLPTWSNESGRSFGLCLHALHPARLRTPSDKIACASIRNGVQLGPNNRPEGYWIANPTDGKLLSGLTAKDFLYVPRKKAHRWTCFHQFHANMPEQVRGISVLSPAMKQFRDLSDYVDYELVGALIASSLTIFMETPVDPMGGSLSGDNASGSASGYPLVVDPGMMVTGQPGHKPHIITNSRPGPTFDAFYERILRAAAASTGQPYEMVAKDFSKTNYSSARAALLEVWKLHTLFQDWFVRGYLYRLWGMVLEEAWLRGMLAVPAGAPSFYDSPLVRHAWLSAVWTRPPRGQIDPVKEREAEQLGLDNYTETRTALCHARGMDFKTLAMTRARENRLMEKLNLQEAPRAGAPAPAPKTYPSDDGPKED